MLNLLHHILSTDFVPSTNPARIGFHSSHDRTQYWYRSVFREYEKIINKWQNSNSIIYCSEEYTRNNLSRLIKNDYEFNVNNTACVRIELCRGVRGLFIPPRLR